MTIHDDALSAFRKVYDDEFNKLTDKNTSLEALLGQVQTEYAALVVERDRALVDISGYVLQLEEANSLVKDRDVSITALNKKISELLDKIKDLEAGTGTPGSGSTAVGAVPLGTAKYPLGTQSVVVTDSASLQNAINNHKPGDTISMRAGTYTSPGFGDSFTKGKGAFTLQNYPGETVKITPSAGSNKGFMILKAQGITLRGFQLDGFRGDWSGNYGTLIFADDTGDGASASNAVLENMFVTNSASFAIRAFGNKTRRLSSVIVRSSTLDGAEAKQLLSTDWTDKFTVESSILRNVNKAGAAFDNSEMAMWKDTVSTNLRANKVVVENAINSVGIWLDQSCVDAAITNVDIKGKTQYAIHIELCGWCVIANVAVTGDAKFAFYNKGSRNIRYWNNTYRGAAQVVFMDEQDDRAGKTSTSDSRQPFISRGLDYFSRENEWVNNDGGTTTATYARMMIYDDQAKTDARSIVSRAVGNLLPVRAPGATASLSLGTPTRKDYTAYTAYTLDPVKFDGNANVKELVKPVAVPSDISTLTGIPAGVSSVGIVRNDLVVARA